MSTQSESGFGIAVAGGSIWSALVLVNRDHVHGWALAWNIPVAIAISAFAITVFSLLCLAVVSNWRRR